MIAPHPERLGRFINQLSAILDQLPADQQGEILSRSAPLMAELVREDDWLDATFAEPHPQHYQQYLLYLDPEARFSVVSFVWGPGQETPIHDHGVWGLIGILRGAEQSRSFSVDNSGQLVAGDCVELRPGEVETLSPLDGDIHQVRNLFSDRVSVSIHVYGADIGKTERRVFLADGSEKLFISGYANVPVTQPRSRH